MKKFQQITLFKTEPQPPPQTTKTSRTTVITGLIRRQLKELETCDSIEWIARNAKLKFKRQEVQHGNI